MIGSSLYSRLANRIRRRFRSRPGFLLTYCPDAEVWQWITVPSGMVISINGRNAYTVGGDDRGIEIIAVSSLDKDGWPSFPIQAKPTIVAWADIRTLHIH